MEFQFSIHIPARGIIVKFVSPRTTLIQETLTFEVVDFVTIRSVDVSIVPSLLYAVKVATVSGLDELR